MAFPFTHPTPDPNPIPRVPVIDGDWWQLCNMPDLGDLAGPNPDRQHIVDHSLVRANDGTWQMWACIRGTRVGRLIYGWEGDTPTQGPWRPVGVKARADKTVGESVSAQGEEHIGSPFFYQREGRYYCIYHTGGGLAVMTSEDGKQYTRRLNANGTSAFMGKYRSTPIAGRDAMIFKEHGLYHLYTCVTAGTPGCARSFVQLVVSPDFEEWSDYINVSEGGIAGNGGVSAESPFVIKQDGFYYLFRASSISFQTYVYRSETPFHFGVHDDNKLVTMLPIKAPEIILHDDQYYITDLADFQGVKIAKLGWEKEGAFA